ncbi:MAG: N-6 DNA methylase, partial [Candidatus Hadarchaeales archaeon]
MYEPEAYPTTNLRGRILKEINQKEKHFARKEKVFGQFMTPPEVANFIVDFAVISLDRRPKLAIDPACGDGVFLKALIKKKINRIVGIDIDESIIPDNLKTACEIFAPRNGLLPLSEEL